MWPEGSYFYCQSHYLAFCSNAIMGKEGEYIYAFLLAKKIFCNDHL